MKTAAGSGVVLQWITPTLDWHRRLGWADMRSWFIPPNSALQEETWGSMLHSSLVWFFFFFWTSLVWFLVQFVRVTCAFWLSHSLNLVWLSYYQMLTCRCFEPRIDTTSCFVTSVLYSFVSHPDYWITFFFNISILADQILMCWYSFYLTSWL
jgi:hypothetical protein